MRVLDFAALTCQKTFVSFTFLPLTYICTLLKLFLLLSFLFCILTPPSTYAKLFEHSFWSINLSYLLQIVEVLHVRQTATEIENVVGITTTFRRVYISKQNRSCPQVSFYIRFWSCITIIIHHSFPPFLSDVKTTILPSCPIPLYPTSRSSFPHDSLPVYYTTDGRTANQ